VKVSKNAWEPSNSIKANPKFFAVAWETGGGGSVAVIPHSATGKLAQGNVPLFTGHKGAVLDLDFNPFNDHLIASVSEDAYGRIWGIPEAGLTESVDEPLQTLRGHKRKVGTCDFHPVAANILATSSADFLIKLWDIEKGNDVYTLEGHTDLIMGLSWNLNGSLFATVAKDKKFRICDPRSQSIVGEAGGHQGQKGPRVIWLQDKDKIFTVGSNKMSEREYMIWDPRTMSEPLAQSTIDNAAGIIMPFYDPDNSILYLAGKGDGNIRYFEIVDEKPFMFALSEYKSATPQKGMAMVPKRALAISECEIARGLKLAAEVCEPISFRVPRKSDLFQDDLYPDTYAGEAALTAEEWMGGANADPKKISLAAGWTAPEKSEVSFEKKVEAAPLSEKEVREEHEKLAKRVAYLEAELAKRDHRIKELEASQ